MQTKTIVVDSSMDLTSCKVGRQGEHDVLKLLLNCKSLKEIYGDGVLTVMYSQPKSSVAFPVDVVKSEEDDDTYEWVIKENVTNRCGIGFATLRWNINSGGLAKTIPLPISVTATYDYNVVDPPEQFDDWIERLEATIRQAEYDVDPVHIARLIEAYFEENPIDAYTKQQSDSKYLKQSDGYKLPFVSWINVCKPSEVITAVNEGKVISISAEDDTYGMIKFTNAVVVNDDTICFIYGVGNYQGRPIIFTATGYANDEDDYWDYSVKTSIVPNENELNQFMKYYKITYSNGRLRDPNGYVLLYNDIRRLFEDQSIFLYLDMDNLVYIPSIDVDDYMPGAIAFSVDWTRSENVGDEEYDQPYISRLIINSQNEIKTTQTGLQSTDFLVDDISGDLSEWGSWINIMYPNVKAVRDYMLPFENKLNQLDEKVNASRYSSMPVVCGTWIDGKTIKRRTYVVASGIAKGNAIKVADKPVDFELLVKGFAISVGNESVKHTMTNDDLLVYVSDDGIFTVNNFTGYAEKMYVTIEYVSNA